MATKAYYKEIVKAAFDNAIRAHVEQYFSNNISGEKTCEERFMNGFKILSDSRSLIEALLETTTWN